MCVCHVCTSSQRGLKRVVTLSEAVTDGWELLDVLLAEQQVLVTAEHLSILSPTLYLCVCVHLHACVPLSPHTHVTDPVACD